MRGGSRTTKRDIDCYLWDLCQSRALLGERREGKQKGDPQRGIGEVNLQANCAGKYAFGGGPGVGGRGQDAKHSKLRGERGPRILKRGIKTRCDAVEKGKGDDQPGVQ